MQLLRRSLAPIIPEAWDEIDEEVRRVLVLNLAGRKLVDFEGPHGWKHAAVNLGRLRWLKKSPVKAVTAGIREVQPLVELRVGATVEQMAVDTIGRGAEDADLEPLAKAAEQLALVEDTAIFHGYKEAGIEGILPASPHDPLPLPEDAFAFVELVARAEQTLHKAKIGGPFALALGPKHFEALMVAIHDGYPLLNHIEKLIKGPVVWAPALKGGAFLSVRGGDFAMTVGQDISVGYAHHDKDSIELYLTETFTFRVIEPAAAIAIQPK